VEALEDFVELARRDAAAGVGDLDARERVGEGARRLGLLGDVDGLDQRQGLVGRDDVGRDLEMAAVGNAMSVIAVVSQAASIVSPFGFDSTTRWVPPSSRRTTMPRCRRPAIRGPSTLPETAARPR
jgi:hypothetical protein